MTRAAERAERIVLAILNGTVDPADALPDLRLANREASVARDVDALRRFRAGESIWSWPAHAPWAGF